MCTNLVNEKVALDEWYMKITSKNKGRIDKFRPNE